jgi:electron transport complex protein RnfB
MLNNLINEIDKLLPQTQCGLCGHGGCLPYATAIAEQGEALNRCPPGGVRVLKQLGVLLKQDITPYIEEMQATEKAPMTAVIREAECIGCMKCIKACPVDAIVGAPKLMHTVLTADCTGCELCVEPCPVDCIDIVPLPSSAQPSDTEQEARASQLRWRFHRHTARLQQQATARLASLTAVKNDIVSERKAFIAAAMARAKAKKARD